MANGLVVVLIIAVALVFDYTNGFHDASNAIATSVSTRALKPRTAALLSAVLNLAGAFLTTKVAATVGKGIVVTDEVTLTLVGAALVGAIAWNLITWRLGLPSSSSHALIGGLLGATIIAGGTGALKMGGIVNKVLVPLVTSPIAGFIGAFVLMIALLWIFRGAPRWRTMSAFRRVQIFSAGYMALAHGSNDAQKTIAIITLA